jgi:hypothetical protein
MYRRKKREHELVSTRNREFVVHCSHQEEIDSIRQIKLLTAVCKRQELRNRRCRKIHSFPKTGKENKKGMMRYTDAGARRQPIIA